MRASINWRRRRSVTGAALWAMMLVAIAILSILSGCASQKAAVAELDARPKFDESFDPLSLTEDEWKISRTRRPGAQDDMDFSRVEAAAGAGARRQGEVLGYRIQIGLTQDASVAREIQRRAQLTFEDDVYLIFSQPYYKVRVGDYPSRFEAEQAQRQAMARGFSEVWVVRTFIKPLRSEE